MRARATAPEFGFPEPAIECKLTPTGKYLATTYGKRVSLFDLPSHKQLANYAGDGSDNWYARYDLADDGRIVVQNGRSADIYRGSTDKVTIDFKQFPGNIASLSFSPHAVFLAIAVGNDCIVYNVSDGKLRSKIAAGGKGFTFSPDDRLVCCATEPGKAATFLSESGTEQRRFELTDPKAEIVARTFSPDSNKLAVGTKDGAVELFDVASGKRVSTKSAGSQQVTNLAFSGDGKRLLTVCGGHLCAIWDVAAGESLATLRRECSAKPRFTVDDKKIIGFHDGAVWTWADNKNNATVETQLGDVNVVACTDDAATTVSLDDYRVRVWKTSQRSLQPVEQSIASHHDPDAMPCVRAGNLECTFDEWGPAVAGVSQATAEAGRPLEMHATSIVAPDGRWKAKAPLSGPPQVFDESGTQILAVLNGHDGPVRALAMSPDGKRLLIAGEDGTVRFWDTDSWIEVATIRHNAAINGLALSEDGTRMFVTFSNDVVLVWDSRTLEERLLEDRAIEHERIGTRQIAATLVSGAQSWGSLATSVLANTDYLPLKRVAVLYELQALINDSGDDATILVEKLKQQLKLKDDVQAAIDKMALSRVQKDKASAELKKWDPSPTDVYRACQQITNDPKESPERWQKVVSTLKKASEAEPSRLDFVYTLGETEYRLGDYSKARELLLTRNSWASNEGRVINWYAQTQQMAYLAMVEQRLGKHDEAARYLHSALRFWGSAEPYDSLQREAAELVQPDAIHVAALPSSDAYKAIQDAIDASDMEAIKKHVGSIAQVKGRVIRICPSAKGAGVNLILDSMTSGPMVWVRFQNDVDWGIVDTIDGHEITVSGPVHELQSDKVIAAWKGRLEIDVNSLDALKVIDKSP